MLCLTTGLKTPKMTTQTIKHLFKDFSFLVAHFSIFSWRRHYHKSSFKLKILFFLISRGDLSPDSSYPESSVDESSETSDRKKGMGQAKGSVRRWGRAIKACSWRRWTGTKYRRLWCSRSGERRVGKECRSRWSPYH